MKLKEPQKDELFDAFNEISSCLPADSDDVLSLKRKVDQVFSCWSNLSDQLSTAQSGLEPSTKLAKAFETAQEKLLAFIKLALNELSSLNSIPSEPESAQQLKIRIDVRIKDLLLFHFFMLVCLFRS